MIGFNHIGRHGRLGNQMFQYAALRGIANKHGYEFTIPDCTFKDEWHDHQLFEAFTLPNLKSKTFIPGTYYQEKQFHYDQEYVDNCPDNVNLFGYFQTHKYFSDIEDSIREDFTFKKDVLEPCKEMMEDFDEIISLHVRRTDYVEKAVDHPPCSMEYYEKALSKFDAKIPVLVFSDEPEWCMKEKLFSGNRFMVSESGDNLIDMCLMTMCTHHIIANSSFSWWGAFLSNSEQIIAPKKWFGTEGYTAANNTQDIIPDTWIKL